MPWFKEPLEARGVPEVSLNSSGYKEHLQSRMVNVTHKTCIRDTIAYGTTLSWDPPDPIRVSRGMMFYKTKVCR